MTSQEVWSDRVDINGPGTHVFTWDGTVHRRPGSPDLEFAGPGQWLVVATLRINDEGGQLTDVARTHLVIRQVIHPVFVAADIQAVLSKDEFTQMPPPFAAIPVADVEKAFKERVVEVMGKILEKPKADLVGGDWRIWAGPKVATCGSTSAGTQPMSSAVAPLPREWSRSLPT